MNFRNQYLAIYRLLLLLLSILVPIFSFVYTFIDPNKHTLPFAREFFTLVGITILIGTYKNKIIRKNIQNIMLALYVFVFLWQYTVLVANNFGQNNILNFLIIGTAICVGFERKKLLYWFLGCSLLATTVVVLYYHDDLSEGLFFLMTLASIYTMMLLVNLRKFYAENKVVQHSNEIRQKNNEILDSISYAKRIQSAILPTRKVLKENLKDSFILYKPKDIVAGDFYWTEIKDDKILFAAADCTGHGVPGAMVSVICNNGLNRSVREFGITDPAKILDKTRELVIQEFEKSEEEMKDGMDIAICSLKGNTLQYAGAHNPLWLIRNNEIIEIKANKQPVGRFDNAEPYSSHSVELQKGDTIYLFTDGYSDQFGGALNKKYKSINFKKFLISIQSSSMDEQLKQLNQEFEDWRGDFEQIDDVCVIGVRIS